MGTNRDQTETIKFAFDSGGMSLRSEAVRKMQGQILVVDKTILI